MAAAEDVGADDEEAAGVDGFAGADEVVPPAGFFVGRGVPTSAVVIAAESMANEDGVVAGGVQRAVGFVAELETGNALAAAEGERMRVDEIARRYEADLAGARWRGVVSAPGADGNVSMSSVIGWLQ